MLDNPKPGMLCLFRYNNTIPYFCKESIAIVLTEREGFDVKVHFPFESEVDGYYPLNNLFPIEDWPRNAE